MYPYAKVSPEETTLEIQEPRPPSLLTLKPKSWRRTVTFGAIGVLLVFVLNISVLIWVASRFDMKNGGASVTTVFTGSCGSTRVFTILGHLAINILSSLILAASSTCMQCLSAPTREIINEAHASGRSLDIGVQSFGNLRYVGAKRVFLWIGLALTSLPLHLMYNSVLSSVTVAIDYDVALVTTTFADSGFWNRSRAEKCVIPFGDATVEFVEYLQTAASTFERLDNSDCIDAYNQQVNTEWANLLLVSNISKGDALMNVMEVSGWLANAASNGFNYPGVAPVEGWTFPGSPAAIPVIPNGYCDFNNAPEYGLYPIEYCLAQKAEPQCRVRFSVVLLATVSACNLVKLVCLFLTLRLSDFQPFVTVGDAISSFLSVPDESTKGFCTLDVFHMKSWMDTNRQPGRVQEGQEYATPSRWHATPRRWLSAIPMLRLLICNFIFFSFLAAGLTLILLAARAVGQFDERFASFSELTALGFGKGEFGTSNLFAIPNEGFVSESLVANSPQLVLSLIYVLYNDLFTRMIHAREWFSYAQNRKVLRVSRPAGAQRSTYFLQLPFKFSVPLLALLALQHWLLSQSLFIVTQSTAEYNYQPPQFPAETDMPSRIMYSPLALIISLVLGATLILLLWGFAIFGKYPAGMPLARSSSVVISAACHAADRDEDAALQPLMWGEVDDNETTNPTEDVDEIIGHATFSSRPVRPLTEGKCYE